jgi:acetyl esterase
VGQDHVDQCGDVGVGHRLAGHAHPVEQGFDEAGTPTRLTEYPEAGHAFLSLPGMVQQAEAARAEILGFLRLSLTG